MECLGLFWIKGLGYRRARRLAWGHAYLPFEHEWPHTYPVIDEALRMLHCNFFDQLRIADYQNRLDAIVEPENLHCHAVRYSVQKAHTRKHGQTSWSTTYHRRSLLVTKC